MDHYKGRGGRAFPLWLDSDCTRPNVAAGLWDELGRRFGASVSVEDLMAYVAAVAAHPEYTRRFVGDLVKPGLRIPLTADADVFAEAANLGRRVIWLHTFGERFADAVAGRPAQPPRLPQGEAPRIPAAGAIPEDPGAMPDSIAYDSASHLLLVGSGFIENVTPEMWAYEVSGKQVLRQWFSYRKANRERPIIGDRRPPSPLGDVQPDHWLAEYTSELLNVLHVLGLLIKLEPIQAELLERICSGPLVSASDLQTARGPVPPYVRPKKKGKRPVPRQEKKLL
jgi:hypothetical protein